MAREKESREGRGEARKVALSAQQVAQLYENERAKFEFLNNQRVALTGRIVETDIAVSAINSAGRGGENEKAMVFIGAGAYLDANLAGNKHVMMNLPGGVVIKMAAKEALDELQKRRAAMESELKGVAAEQEKAANNMNTWARVISEGRRLSAEKAARQNRGS